MRLRDRVKAILTIKERPHIVAMSFAVGVFIGMSPLIGIHTILALLFAWLFRLNKLVAITGVYITNPWSIIPIYTFCTWVGTLLLGMDRLIPRIDWNHITVGKLTNTLSELLLPFIVGTVVVGTVGAVLSYIIVRRAMERRQRR